MVSCLEFEETESGTDSAACVCVDVLGVLDVLDVLDVLMDTLSCSLMCCDLKLSDDERHSFPFLKS